MRRRVGVGAVQKARLTEEKFRQKGDQLTATELRQLDQHIDAFKSKLEEFAAKHKKDIRHDPKFRKKFQEMCANIGVDPLASSKGFWANLLGVGDFYYELAVQIIEVCLATKSLNGGLISLADLLARVRKGKNREGITVSDIETAIKKIRVLGTGFQLISTNGGQYIQSVATELSLDQADIIKVGELHNGMVTTSIMLEEHGWPEERTQQAIKGLLQDGLVWLDDGGKEDAYWFPAIFLDKRSDVPG